MTQAGSLLRWQTGQGWLVLVGGGDFQEGETEIIDSQTLVLTDPEKAVVFVPTASNRPQSRGPAFLEYIEEDLGGPGGYVLPLYSADDGDNPDVRALLASAGLIVIGGGDRRAELAGAFQRPAALEGLAQAFTAGAVIYGAAAGASVLGSLVALDDRADEVREGLGWIGRAFVEPHFDTLENSPRVRALLDRHPESFCLGIPNRVALALGPKGEVETWGVGKVTVSLGATWKQE